MAQVETLDTFENNRAAVIEVDIFSDTNVRMSVGMHLRVLPGMHVSMCARAASLIIYQYFIIMYNMCNIFICALLCMYFLY